MRDYVFVYGTLRRRFHNHHLLARAQSLGGGRTVEKYALYTDDYPYVVEHQPVSHIVGELYKIDAATLLILDALEEHPHEYCRKRTRIVADDGIECEAWLYFYPKPRGRLLISGDFCEDGDEPDDGQDGVPGGGGRD